MDLEERREIYRLGRELDLFTPLQERTMAIWATGAGYRRCAVMLLESRDTIRGRVERARDKVERAIVRNLSDGRSWAEIGEQVGRRSRIVTADRYSHALIDYREVDRAVLRR